MDVVVTGMGVVSPLGVDLETVRTALASGASAAGHLTLAEPLGGCEHAAEVGAYDWKEHLLTKQTYADRCTQLALGAARQALDQAGIELPLPRESEPVGLTFGTQWGCLESLENFYTPVANGTPRRASSLVFSHSYPNCPTSVLAIEFGLRGYSTSFAGSPQAGQWALQSGADAIRSGTLTQVLAGGSDALVALRLRQMAAEGSLPATAGLEAPSLDDAVRDRLPGEGAIFFLLESREAASAAGRTGPLLPASLDELVATPLPGPCTLGDAGVAGPLLRCLAGLLVPLA